MHGLSPPHTRVGVTRAIGAPPPRIVVPGERSRRCLHRRARVSGPDGTLASVSLDHITRMCRNGGLDRDPGAIGISTRTPRSALPRDRTIAVADGPARTGGGLCRPASRLWILGRAVFRDGVSPSHRGGESRTDRIAPDRLAGRSERGYLADGYPICAGSRSRMLWHPATCRYAPPHSGVGPQYRLRADSGWSVGRNIPPSGWTGPSVARSSSQAPLAGRTPGAKHRGAPVRSSPHRSSLRGLPPGVASHPQGTVRRWREPPPRRL